MTVIKRAASRRLHIRTKFRNWRHRRRPDSRTLRRIWMWRADLEIFVMQVCSAISGIYIQKDCLFSMQWIFHFFLFYSGFWWMNGRLQHSRISEIVIFNARDKQLFLLPSLKVKKLRNRNHNNNSWVSWKWENSANGKVGFSLLHYDLNPLS